LIITTSDGLIVIAEIKKGWQSPAFSISVKCSSTIYIVGASPAAAPAVPPGMPGELAFGEPAGVLPSAPVAPPSVGAAASSDLVLS
jgi:hypothetical protein